jgi:hypothetical protein
MCVFVAPTCLLLLMQASPGRMICRADQDKGAGGRGRGSHDSCWGCGGAYVRWLPLRAAGTKPGGRQVLSGVCLQQELQIHLSRVVLAASGKG